MKISRDQALCVCYQLGYNEENVAKAKQKLAVMDDEWDVCYLTNQSVPVLALSRRINGNPFLFHRYLTTAEKDHEDDNAQTLQTKQHIVSFLNQVYTGGTEIKNNIYEWRTLSLSDIFSTVIKHTSFFDGKTLNAFASFCGKNYLSFLKAINHAKRRKKNETYQRTWSVNVMKEEYHGTVINNIVSYLPKYHSFINQQKRDGAVIIGYVRKSPGNEKEETRLRLLKAMIQNLKDRSLVDKIYASPSSKSSERMVDRDSTTEEPINGSDGRMTELIDFLNSTTSNVILVVLDYAGWSTNLKDICNFLSDHPNISQIIVDRFPVVSKVEVYEAKQILEDDDVLENFNCRRGSVHRAI